MHQSTARALAIIAAPLLLAGCAVGQVPSDGGEAAELSAGSTSTLSRVTGPTVVAVGDIACRPGAAVTETECRHADVAKLARGYRPRRVLGLGDLQYEEGRLRAFRLSYDTSWGTLKSITRPVPGNHEYRTSGAAGYFRYFRRQQPGSPGYYAFDQNRWRIYAVNTNCGDVDCDRQARWLRRNMNDNPRRCSIMMLHHPLYSSGAHGNNPRRARRFTRIAVAHRTDISLAGHDHDYERFRKMNAAGDYRRRGIQPFVSGLGGKSIREFREAPATGSLVRYNGAPGVLALRLGSVRYAWEFKDVNGEVIDSGVRRCR